jgi:hypothetical protein
MHLGSLLVALHPSLVESNFNYSIALICLIIMLDYVSHRPKGQCIIYYLFIFWLLYCTIEFSCLCDVVLTPSGLTLRRKTRRLLYVGDES